MKHPSVIPKFIKLDPRPALRLNVAARRICLARNAARQEWRWSAAFMPLQRETVPAPAEYQAIACAAMKRRERRAPLNTYRARRAAMTVTFANPMTH
jgi:hypothetical protein